MSVASIADPLSSAEFQLPDLDRVAEVTRRHRLLADRMTADGLSAVLLEDPGNLAWFTMGGEFRIGGSELTQAVLFVTPDARVIVCGNADTQQIFQKTLPGLGFQLKERAWTEAREGLVADLCRGRQVGSDRGFPGTVPYAEAVADCQGGLVEGEVQAVRDAGRLVAHALEATCRNLRPGRTEAELAGELAHRLLKHDVQAVRLQVAADGRAAQFRNWGWSTDVVQSYCSLVAVGRYRGLHVGAARTVCLGQPPSGVWEDFQKLALVHGAALAYTHAGQTVADMWDRVKRVYVKAGVDDEWRRGDQGCLVGYRYPATRIGPSSTQVLEHDQAVLWTPGVGAVLSGDSVLITEAGTARLTPPTEWPTVGIEARGQTISVPGILVLECP